MKHYKHKKRSLKKPRWRNTCPMCKYLCTKSINRKLFDFYICHGEKIVIYTDDKYICVETPNEFFM